MVEYKSKEFRIDTGLENDIKLDDETDKIIHIDLNKIKSYNYTYTKAESKFYTQASEKKIMM